jgi:uncharacterized membrane-anchored protein
MAKKPVVEAKDLQKMNAENQDLTTRLTNKNSQYMFDVAKRMEEAKLPEATKVEAMNDLLKKLDAAPKGMTARQLFGTVTETADKIIGGGVEEKAKEEEIGDRITNPFVMIADNFLLLLCLLGVLSGVFSMFTKGNQTQYGIVTLIVMSLIGAVVFYLMYFFVYRFERPGADKSKKPGMVKIGLIMVVAIVVWMTLLTLTMLLPVSLNPVIGAVPLIIIGAVAFLLRFAIRKKWKIQSSMQARY